MFITKIHVPRRTFLKGLGATIALPLLDAMSPAATAQSRTAAGATVRRFAAAYVPNGMVMEMFTPEAAGTGFSFTPILKPLEAYRDSVVVVSNLSNGGVRSGGHSLPAPMYLTGVKNPKRTEGLDLRAGTTIDQVLSKQPEYTGSLFPTMEIAAEDFTTSAGSCEGGFSCVYQNTITWASPTTPLPMEINPRLVFERMFGGATGTPAQRAARLRARRSVLDAVSDSARRLQATLASGDRARIDQYLQNVREIELRLQRVDDQKAANPNAVEPVGIPDDYSEHVALMWELMVVAFQADITRVFTFLVARELSNQMFPQLGFNDPHHAISHHQNKPDKIAKYTAMNAHHTSLVAGYVKKLKETPDGDGKTLLDNSLLLYGSGMSNGDNHSYDPLPVVLIGGDSGRLQGGRHLVLPPDTPMANLMVTLAQRGGVAADSFGDSSTGSITL